MSVCRRCLRKNKKGFTLAEVLVYLIVMGALLGLASAAVGLNDKNLLARALINVQSDLRLAKRLAVTANGPARVVFNLSEHSYIVQNRQSGAYKTARAVKLGSVTIESMNASAFTVSYNSRGTTADACTIVLKKGAYRGSLTVNIGAGRVQIKDIIRL